PVPGAVDTHSSPPIVLLVPSSPMYEVIDFRSMLVATFQLSVSENTSDCDVLPTTPWRLSARVVSRPVTNGPYVMPLRTNSVPAGHWPFAPGATFAGIKAAAALPPGCASAAVRVLVVMQRVCVVKVWLAGASVWFGVNTAVCEFGPPP